MHELSLAASIVESVTQEMQRKKLPPVQTIALRLGALSNVDSEALRFSFDAIVSDTPLAGAKLEIERVAVQGNCRACQHNFAVHDFVFACPRCNSGQIDMTRGDELDIAYLEVAEDEELKASASTGASL